MIQHHVSRNLVGVSLSCASGIRKQILIWVYNKLQSLLTVVREHQQNADLTRHIHKRAFVEVQVLQKRISSTLLELKKKKKMDALEWVRKYYLAHRWHFWEWWEAGEYFLWGEGRASMNVQLSQLCTMLLKKTISLQGSTGWSPWLEGGLRPGKKEIYQGHGFCRLHSGFQQEACPYVTGNISPEICYPWPAGSPSWLPACQTHIFPQSVAGSL